MKESSKELYRGRRAELMERMGRGSVGIWMSPLRMERSTGVFAPFFPDASLLYLTGCEEEEAVLVLDTTGEQNEESLYLPGRDVWAEAWTGRRLEEEEAQRWYGLQQIRSLSHLAEDVVGGLSKSRRLFYHLGRCGEQDQQVLGWWNRASERRRRAFGGAESICDPGEVLGAMRSIKQPDELEHMRKAAEITVDGMHAAMKAAGAGVGEYQVEAVLAHHFRSCGGGDAFGAIVASGENAMVLHYQKNSRHMQEGELLLIDAGAQWSGYAADCARTVPVGGSFSAQQRDAYALVLAAQKAAIAQCIEGARLSDVHDTAVRVLLEGLVALGVLKGDVDTLQESAAVRAYFPHQTSHWVGLDVHDVGERWESDGGSRILRDGMVLTVEPGLYFNPALRTDGTVTPYDGVGIRIEDVVRVGRSGPEVLTAGCCKEIDEVEALGRSEKG